MQGDHGLDRISKVFVAPQQLFGLLQPSL